METRSVNLIVQGDVFLIPCETIPQEAKMLRLKHLTLAVGESTGHAHVANLGMLFIINNQLFFSCQNTATITHEEHLPVTVPPGTWKVGIVREYDPFLEESRTVQD